MDGEEAVQTRTGGARRCSLSVCLSVLGLHFRMASRIQSEEGTLVASFSTFITQPAKE